MESELRDLYQELILDHGRHPRNFRRLEGECRCRQGYNPLCGDQLELCLSLDEAGRIDEIGFQGQGCAISIASASLLSERLKGCSVAEAKALFEAFHRLLTEPAGDPETQQALGKLRVLAGVREFPTRIKCATLAWHTLLSALGPADSAAEPVRTE